MSTAIQVGKLARTVLQAEMTERTTIHPEPMCSVERFAEWLKLQTFNDPEILQMAVACREWAHSFREKRKPRWLTILGPCGIGKTHCAQRLWTWAHNRFPYDPDLEFIPQAIHWPNFVQRLKSGNWYDYRDDLKRWPVLFLDDIGSERDTSGFASEELSILLSMRMGTWTLLTSNLTFERLGNIDERISSRLLRGSNICIEVKAIDYSTREFAPLESP